MREVRVAQEVACPRCQAGPHEVEILAVVSAGTLYFGGPGQSPATQAVAATVVCPTTGERFDTTVSVPVKSNERVMSARVVGEGADGDAEAGRSPGSVVAPPEPQVVPAAPEDSRYAELLEAGKASADRARDAAGKLLAAGTAAVGAYVAILKLIAGDTIGSSDRVVAILPPIGYLVVCVLAGVALRPVLTRVWTLEEFERERERRLESLNQLLIAAVAVFILATALAVVAYWVAMP